MKEAKTFPMEVIVRCPECPIDKENCEGCIYCEDVDYFSNTVDCTCEENE